MPGAALSVLPGRAAGRVLHLTEPLSFWGGVDPASGRIIDVHHPQHGASLAGAVVAVSSTRGSCTGSGVVLELALAGFAPAALAFAEPEDVATLGALVAAEMFERSIPVVRLDADAFRALAEAREARIGSEAIETDAGSIPVRPLPEGALALSNSDRLLLDGAQGPAAALAMRILCAIARQQGAASLTDVTRVHIDGCIYASPANLVFAEAMEGLGARVRVPATMNAISVDHANWRAQGVPESFGAPAARLADSYVAMGCRPTFTCAPYLLDGAPARDEAIGWSESNAVIFANSVLGARTAKHPDFLDLCIAITGRAPLSGPYLDAERMARRIVEFSCPPGAGDSFWPLAGYLAGLASPDCIPLLRGLAAAEPGRDDLKALCAAFGTTSAAPMLHVEGVTPEADRLDPQADTVRIGHDELRTGWQRLNNGPEAVDLVAIGSPHASLEECRALAERLAGRPLHPGVHAIVTAGRQVLAEATREGLIARLSRSGVQVIGDLCWCSISRPVFPPDARVVLTNSGKYAHYGPGLSGCAVRLGTLDDCVEAIVSGRAPARLPSWLG
ncbi:aconitase X [Aureimonas sp. AU4]|uniref:cis-3-hydroxy-L-proline dehydratase n=1 Tax=Aureimonas sp. AU4 TaxID=1638163 RepID=UPI000784D97A|nr:aconitase family protein [Aureimonas sp. AU4]